MKLGIIRVPAAKLLKLFLAVGVAFSPLIPALAAAINGSAPGSPLTVLLASQEAPQSFLNTSLSIIDEAKPFKKEPVLAKGALRRGHLEFPGQPRLAFLWDQSRGDLYLDLNHNEDLTDDPAGVFHSQGSSSSSNYRFGFFVNVRLPIQTKAGSYSWVADLNFSEYSGRLNVFGAQRSFWSAKLNLAGQDYQLAVITSPSDRPDVSNSGSLLLRPWSASAEAFDVASGSLEAVPFPSKLFFNHHLYQVERTWVAQGDKLACQLKLTETPAALGRLKLSGKSIHRLMLTGGPCVAVLDSPSEVVEVPTGRYQNYQVQLGQGAAAAHLDRPSGFQEHPVAIAGNSLAQLTVGGPLTNTVSINRRGQFLVLSYQLLGADGQAYQLKSRDMQNPPRFAIYQGERQLASGKFEFG